MRSVRFNVGDRVESKYDEGTYTGAIHVGDLGTVREVDSHNDAILVEWDNNVGGHNGLHGRACKNGHGWWVIPSQIAHVCEDIIPLEFSTEEFYEFIKAV